MNIIGEGVTPYQWSRLVTQVPALKDYTWKKKESREYLLDIIECNTRGLPLTISSHGISMSHDDLSGVATVYFVQCRTSGVKWPIAFTIPGQPYPFVLLGRLNSKGNS